MSLGNPIILAVVSGKGGVGKTMLSVSLAQELSLGAPTLLIDLDFFNRGLTGLMRSGETIRELKRPTFLPDINESDADAVHLVDSIEQEPLHQEEEDDSAFQLDIWSLVKVSGNLFHLKYPDLVEKDYRFLESFPISEFVRELGNFVRSLARECDCEFVVLDCHGGPDKTSFAASHVAEHTLLISEPDRITLYGTLNFLRQLESSGEAGEPDVRLIFNKVVPSFSMPFLRRFYNQNLRSEFGDHPLLAVFPMEGYLTKGFEKNTLLTLVYPNSLLARKTRTYIYDLLALDHGDKVAAAITSVPRLVRWFRSVTLGKKFFLLSNNFATATIFAVGMTFAGAVLLVEFGSSLISDDIMRTTKKFIDLLEDTPFFAILAVFWFFSTLVQDWLTKVDRAMTYKSRTRGLSLSLCLSFLQVLLLAPFLVFSFAVWNEIGYLFFLPPKEFAEALIDDSYEPTLALFTAGIFSSSIVGYHVFDQAIRLYRNYRYENHRFDDILRSLLLLGTIFVLFITIKLS